MSIDGWGFGQGESSGSFQVPGPVCFVWRGRGAAAGEGDWQADGVKPRARDKTRQTIKLAGSLCWRLLVALVLNGFWMVNGWMNGQDGWELWWMGRSQLSLLTEVGTTAVGGPATGLSTYLLPQHMVRAGPNTNRQ